MYMCVNEFGLLNLDVLIGRPWSFIQAYEMAK